MVIKKTTKTTIIKMPKINRKPIKEQKEQFIAAFKRNLAIITLALSECKITYNTYKKWRETDPDFNEKCIEVENIQIDFVENKLMELIAEKNVTAVIYFLKCRRPNKWSDRQVLQVEGSVDHNVKQVQINVMSNETKQLMENTLKIIDTEGKEI